LPTKPLQYFHPHFEHVATRYFVKRKMQNCRKLRKKEQCRTLTKPLPILNRFSFFFSRWLKSHRHFVRMSSCVNAIKSETTEPSVTIFVVYYLETTRSGIDFYLQRLKVKVIRLENVRVTQRRSDILSSRISNVFGATIRCWPRALILIPE